jgi:hypothetical protein
MANRTRRTRRDGWSARGLVMAAVVTVLVVAAIAFGMSLSSISHTSGPQTTHTQ